MLFSICLCFPFKDTRLLIFFKINIFKTFFQEIPKIHCGVVDKPLTMYPGAPSLIPSSSSLSDETITISMMAPASPYDLSCWWDAKHKLTYSLTDIN